MSEVIERVSLLVSKRAKIGLVVSGGELCEVEGSNELLILGCGNLS
jgi:hypothetical protein